MTAAVEVDGLVKRYGQRAVLDGVSFAIAPGELFALLGPNGAGKTTTVEILEGYRRADGGVVRVLGLDPAVAGPPLRARVGLMLQGGGGIDPRAEPLETLRLFADFHDPARDPDELLDLVGLRGVARTRFRRLSGGERQRLGLALALVGNPDLLILDEPTAGMDPEARVRTRALIRDLRAAGTTILLTTHDLADVERLADRVAILHRGRIVALGAPDAIAASATPMLRFRLPVGAALDGLGDRLAAVRPGVRLETVEDEPGAWHVVAAAPDPGLVAALAGWCAEAGILLTELATGRGSLEERYLELTGDRTVEHAE